jgi:hypothetical protein
MFPMWCFFEGVCLPQTSATEHIMFISLSILYTMMQIFPMGKDNKKAFKLQTNATKIVTFLTLESFVTIYVVLPMYLRV